MLFQRIIRESYKSFVKSFYHAVRSESSINGINNSPTKKERKKERFTQRNQNKTCFKPVLGPEDTALGLKTLCKRQWKLASVQKVPPCKNLLKC